MAEIDDNELATLRAAAKFIQLVESQEGGTSQIEQWAKKINPKVRTTADTVEEYAKPYKEEIEKLSKWKEGMENKIDSYNKQESLNKVKKSYGFTDEGIKSLEKFAEEKGIKDIEVAAAYWEKTNPSAAAKPSYAGSSYSMAELGGIDDKDDAMKRLAENPLRFQEEETRKFLNEIRNKPQGEQWE